MNEAAASSHCPAGSRRAFLLLLLTALVIRGGVVAARRAELQMDPDAYRLIAENLRETGVYGQSYEGVVYPTAYRPPLYPLTLAGIAWNGHVYPLAVGVLHVVLGVATVCLTYLLARQWNLGRASYVAALGVTLDPILLNQSTLVMTETLATFLAVVCLLFLSRWARRPTSRGTALCGGILGVACLCRPTFLAWLVLVAIVMLVRGGLTRRALHAPALLVAAMAVLIPWTVRNHLLLGKPIFATTHGGYTLLLGNNPHFYQHLEDQPAGTVWDASQLQHDIDESEPERLPYADELVNHEVQQDRESTAAALEHMGADPSAFTNACLVRVGRLWTPLPHQLTRTESDKKRLSRYAVACWYVVAFVLAVAGIAARRRDLFRTPWVWGLLLCVAFTMVHTLYWSNMRMRAPLMPFVYLLAAAGFESVRNLRRRRKSFEI